MAIAASLVISSGCRLDVRAGVAAWRAVHGDVVSLVTTSRVTTVCAGSIQYRMLPARAPVATTAATLLLLLLLLLLMMMWFPQHAAAHKPNWPQNPTVDATTERAIAICTDIGVDLGNQCDFSPHKFNMCRPGRVEPCPWVSVCVWGWGGGGG